MNGRMALESGGIRDHQRFRCFGIHQCEEMSDDVQKGGAESWISGVTDRFQHQLQKSSLLFISFHSHRSEA
jgi:hypothetical protein